MKGQHILSAQLIQCVLYKHLRVAVNAGRRDSYSSITQADYTSTSCLCFVRVHFADVEIDKITLHDYLAVEAW